MPSRRWLLPVLITLTLFLLPAILLGLAAMLAYPTLPSLEALTDYRPKIPLRIYSAEGTLLSEFGEERRALVKLSLIHISEPTRLGMISYAVFCLKKKKKK